MTNERELTIVFHQNGLSTVSARLIAPGSRLVGFGPACEASVVLSYGTAYYGLEADPTIFETAVRALAEGNALRATARIVQVDKDTVCAWLHRVACHCRTVMLYFWHDLHVSECQLDELWSFVHTKEAHLPATLIVTPMGTPGCGSPLPQSGAWSWPS